MTSGANQYVVRASGLSDVGCVREANEDAFAVLEQQGLFIVSDGMGGERAGALASAMVVKALPLQLSAERLASNLGAPDANQMARADRLVRTIALVNDMVLDRTRNQPEVKGLGATVVADITGKDTGDGPLGAQVAQQVRLIVDEQLKQALAVLKENRHVLDALVAELLKKNRLTREEMQVILDAPRHKKVR